MEIRVILPMVRNHKLRNENTYNDMSLFYQLIEIANLSPEMKEIPDYDTELQVRYHKATGNFFDLSKLGNHKAAWEIVLEMWDEIMGKYPVLGKYAETAAETPIGRRIFELIPQLEGQTNLLVDNPQVTEDFINNQKIITLKFFLDAKYITALKLQNFIRLTRLRHNMKLVALIVRLLQLRRSAAIRSLVSVPDESYTRWKDEMYFIPGLDKREIFPFALRHRVIKNVATAKLKFLPSIIQLILEEIDVLRIKTCLYCFKIFFAKPRNMKYCSETCNNRMKSHRYHEANKLKILEKKRNEYRNKKELKKNKKSNLSE